jgi:hypothetical protein
MQIRRVSSFAVAFLTGLALASAANAQATRTWVSGVGDDANPCSRTAPCKTFAGAISKTAAGGEISVLDPGGFGAVTITKSITISGDGTLAGILSAGTNGIIINAGATGKVFIRHISIAGAGTGLNGMRILSAGEVTVEGVTLDGFTTTGIDVAATANVNINLYDVRIGNAVTGIKAATTAGVAVLMLDNVKVAGVTTGIDLGANARASVRNSSFNRTTNGMLLSTATAVADLENVLFAFNNTAGLNASVAGATARISNCQFFNNSNGILTVGTVSSANNNKFAGNSVAGTPNGPAITVQ